MSNGPKNTFYDSGSSGTNINGSDPQHNNRDRPKMVIDKPNQFPWKLWDMLDSAEKKGEEHVIGWIRDGRAFKVHNRDRFIEDYMKKQFNQTKFKSFQRQLNLWGFERIQSGPDKGSYYHPLFVKDRRECCQRLTRVRLKSAPSETKPPSSNGTDALGMQDRKPAATISTNVTGAPIAAGIPSSGLLSVVSAATMVLTPSPMAASLPPIHELPRHETPRISAIEATLRGGSQQHMADMRRFQRENRQRTFVPDASGFSTEGSFLQGSDSTRTPERSALVINGLLQYQQELAQQQRQQLEQQQLHDHARVRSTGHALPRQAQPLKLPLQLPEEQAPQSVDLAPATNLHNGNGQSTTTRSDEMAALLAVSAQRRREEALSKTKGVDI